MIGDALTAIFVIALLYIFCRPGSKGSAFITAFTTASVAVIGKATDLAGATEDDDDEGEFGNTTGEDLYGDTQN